MSVAAQMEVRLDFDEVKEFECKLKVGGVGGA
jgi:hypothetical protein